MSDSRVDPVVFKSLEASLGTDFVGELMQTFFTDSPRLLAELRRALDQRDRDAFRRAAHTLKSNAATFGASHLAALSKELEVLAREERLEQVGGRVDALADEYEAVRSSLQELRHGG